MEEMTRVEQELDKWTKELKKQEELYSNLSRQRDMTAQLILKIQGAVEVLQTLTKKEAPVSKEPSTVVCEGCKEPEKK
jgi:hypothetical protein